MSSRPLRIAVKALTVATSAGAATIGGLGALAYAQARRAVARPGENEVGFYVDGLVGPPGATPRRMVWIGDSLAAGLGATSAEVSLPRFVAAARGETVNVHSYATPGATSTDVVEHQLPALELFRHGLAEIGQRIDAIGVTVGSNDIASFTPRHRLRRNLHAIVEAAEGSPLAFVSIPQLGDALRLPNPLRSFARLRAAWLDRAIRRVAAAYSTVEYAPVRRRPEWIRRADRAKFLSADLFHPSGSGYAIWASRVGEAFDALLAPDPTTT